MHNQHMLRTVTCKRMLSPMHVTRIVHRGDRCGILLIVSKTNNTTLIVIISGFICQ